MKRIVGGFCLSAALFAVSAYAVTPPEITVTDGTNICIVDSAGVLTSGGGAGCAGLSGAGSVAGSKVTVTGVLAASAILSLSGVASPAGSPTMDLNTSVTALAGVTVRVLFTGSDFTIAPATTLMTAGGNTSTATFTSFFDSANVLCFVEGSCGTLIGTVVGNGGPAAEAPIPTLGPFSLSEEWVVSLGAGRADGADNALTLTSSSGAGCPAPKGSWKNANFPQTLVFPVTIAGVSYSAADFYTILGSTGSGNAVNIMGSQLVAAILNEAAGATQNSTINNAIASAESLLSIGLPGGPPGVAFPINMTSSKVGSSTALGRAMLSVESTLEGYNSGFFGTCLVTN